MKKAFILFLLLAIAFIKINALKIDRVILATDANPDYIEFWPIVAKAWKEIVDVKPTLALIADKNVIIDESLGEVIRFEPIDGIPISLQAQAIRLLLPSYFGNECCLISDIDMIPLNKEYFINSIKNCPENSFVVYRDNAYNENEKKFPMCYIAAKGKTFKEVFKIPNKSSIPDIIKKWSNKNLGWNTDELLLYKYLTNWKNYNNRCIKLGHGVERRIDRSYWAYDNEFLKRGYYIDAHCPRPYNSYKSSIDELLYELKQPKTQTRCLENADYGTHMAPLLTAVMLTDGPVLEMGAGDFSTPLLHAICVKNKRFLLTADTDKKWLNNFIDLKNDWHNFEYIPVYEDDWSINPKPQIWDNVGSDKHWSVVLIDHRPGERRVKDITRLRDNTEIFVIHDTQQPSYGYEPILNTFKYKYVYKRYSTQTTLVSDKVDVSKLFE